MDLSRKGTVALELHCVIITVQTYSLIGYFILYNILIRSSITCIYRCSIAQKYSDNDEEYCTVFHPRPLIHVCSITAKMKMLQNILKKKLSISLEKISSVYLQR